MSNSLCFQNFSLGIKLVSDISRTKDAITWCYKYHNTAEKKKNLDNGCTDCDG